MAVGRTAETALIGLDVGTTGCKAMAFSPDGCVLGSAYGEYGILGGEPGKAEQDAEEVWRITKGVLRQAASASPLEVEALSVSVQGDAIIPVDRRLRPLHNAVLGMDYRSARQAERCAELFGSRKLFDLTGMRPHPINSLVKLLWLRETRPEVYGASWKIMTYADFVLARMGADPTIDHTMASRSMGFDLKRREWSAEILGELEIDPTLLSEARPSAEAVGTMDPELAREIGLAKPPLLATGGHDQTCAGIGAGLVEEGRAVVSTGTAEVLSSAFPEPKLGDAVYESYYPCYLHAKAGMHFTFSLNHVGGILLQWYKDAMGSAEVEEAEARGVGVYQLMDRKAPTEPTNLFVLPHFNGSGTPWCDLESKGAVVGLSLATTRHDIYRSVLESLALELRINLETMERAGIRIEELRAVGGGAKSPLWLGIKADVLERPIHTLEVSEAACLGAAVLAGAASGVYGSVDEGVERAVRLQRSYRPDPGRASRYAEKYAIYKELYPALEPVNRRLS